MSSKKPQKTLWYNRKSPEHQLITNCSKLEKIANIQTIVTKDRIKLSLENERAMFKELKDMDHSTKEYEKKREKYLAIMVRVLYPWIFKKIQPYFSITNADPDELFSYAKEGIIKSFDKFDIDRYDGRFANHADFYIRVKIGDYLDKDSRLISLPHGYFRRLNKRIGLIRDNAKDPEEADIEIEKEQSKYYQESRFVDSIDRKIRNDDEKGITVAETLKSGSFINDPGTEYDYGILREAVSQLSDEQRTIITKYFGLDDGKYAGDISGIAEEMGMPKPKADYIKRVALKKLKHTKLLSPLNY